MPQLDIKRDHFTGKPKSKQYNIIILILKVAQDFHFFTIILFLLESLANYFTARFKPNCVRPTGGLVLYLLPPFIFLVGSGDGGAI